MEISTNPDDVWRMEDGGLAWRLCVKVALGWSLDCSKQTLDETTNGALSRDSTFACTNNFILKIELPSDSFSPFIINSSIKPGTMPASSIYLSLWIRR